MKPAMKQANFQIPKDQMNELRATEDKDELSRFVSEPLKRKFQRHFPAVEL